MHPSYINSSTINQQRMTSFHYNNGNNFVAADGPVILENNCLTGNRSSKKDRHSKINTARGPRDRRMRLSLDVAKKFFNLQDMLGFDKASNTIEWLLVKSKPAIRDLLISQSCSLIMGVSNSHSPSASGSDCEVVSGIDDQILMEKTGEDNKVSVKDKEKFNSCSNNNKEKKKVKRVRKSVYIDHSLAKETREKARARARNRTTEKKNIKLGLDQNTNRFGSWIPFGESQVQLTDQAEYPSSHFQFRQGINVGDSSSINWSPSLFNYLHNSGISHEHQVISDLQILGKPWEGINN